MRSARSICGALFVMVLVLPHLGMPFTRSPRKWSFQGWSAIQPDLPSRAPKSGCST